MVRSITVAHFSTGGAQRALLGAAVLVAYAPMVMSLANTTWQTDQNSHGPIVLAMAIWYFLYRSVQIFNEKQFADCPTPLGWLPLGIGGLLYILGISQDFHLATAASLIPFLAGLVLLVSGAKTLRRMWFAFFFLIFIIPLPGAVIDALTQPLKSAVSWGAVEILRALEYPVSRAGVIISIGPYQLLVADACAGLNSLFTLESLGLMYMNIIRHESVTRNAILAICIVPISFASNLIRVITLSLITFYFGDEAGQGFVHSFSGVLLFLTALFLIIALDGMLRRVDFSRLSLGR